MKVRGIVLAAVRGSPLGAVKQLLPLHGKPLLQHAINAARTSTLAHLPLVLVHSHAENLAEINAPNWT